MSTTTSRQLSIRQLRTLKQLGDVMAPGHGQLPCFSETGCIYHIDDLLAFSPLQDVRELKYLLTFLSFIPSRYIPLFINLLDTFSSVPGVIGRQCRLGFWGIKGLIFSLYYSNLTNPYQVSSGVHQAIGYHVNCQPLVSNHTIKNAHQES